MPIFHLDPILDARWGEFVESSPEASIFHSVGWIKSLRDTYGYLPIAFTSSPPTAELKNGLVGCSIDSWITGRRFVALPFSDHCAPLVASDEEWKSLLDALLDRMAPERWQYLEIRPVRSNSDPITGSAGFVPGMKYFLHLRTLKGSLDEIFAELDKDSVQRRIRHAERSGLAEKTGASDELLNEFYKLFVVTRGRHRIPPMPYAWFKNLIKNLRRQLEIRVAYLEKTPVAGILTLRFKNTLYYKYGCSDSRFNRLGAMPWLLWKGISDGVRSGAEIFDMGRTEESNQGLLTFKNHWVPTPKPLVYWRFPAGPNHSSPNGWKLKTAMRIFSLMPSGLLTLSGKLIYRHIG